MTRCPWTFLHSALRAAAFVVPLVLGCARPAENSGPETAGAVHTTSNRPTAETVRLGDGFAVWESNRSGRWRLWIRDLDGGEARQLTLDEGHRLHCCPHVSPDGQWIAFMSLPADQTGYPPGGAIGALNLIRPDASELRELLPEARNYYENRAAVWRSPTELIYIRADGQTALLDVVAGETRPLTSQAVEEYPWLINSRLTWAASGSGAFSPYDAERRQVAARAPFQGCQPYFSHDGRWGFWVVAPGGPIRQLDLDGGVTSTLLKKSDPRLPPDYGYLYFPMLSRDGRLFAFAASPDEHHHFKADYEVFVVETEPESFEILGDPIRLTHHSATDRFPDVHLAPLPLGRHYGEAPFHWSATPAGPERAWRWDYGDGTSATGTVGEHTFTTPGRFTVRALTDGSELHGQIVVAEARAPQVLSVLLMRSGQEIAVSFDEPVRLTRLAASLESGIDIEEHRLDHDGRRLRLAVSAPIRRPDRLNLTGISDRAQQPNLMSPTTLTLEPPLWPADRSGLAFLWESGDAPNLLYDAEIDAESAVILTAKGTARLDHDFALAPAGGRFVAPKGLGQRIARQCQQTYELTLEAVIEPDSGLSGGSGTILTTATKSRRNFILEQRGQRLVLGIRMKGSGQDAVPRVPMIDLPPGRKSHVVLAYSPGLLSAYLDGEPVKTDETMQDGFFHWKAAPLTIGGDWNGSRPWRGKLEGLAIFNRALGAEEVVENFQRYRAKLEARRPIPRWTVTATRSDCSVTPTLEEISPYREALSVCEYRVTDVLEGEDLGNRLRVAQWSILDGQRLSPGGDGSSESAPLELTRFEDNPQLESVYLSDTLQSPGDASLFYLARP